MAKNIIDSLFLELGIDTTKFSKDQANSLAKIKQFETQVKNSAGKARGGIQTVGEAFRDLAKDSSVGSSAARLDNLATKFKNLGASLQVAGGAGTPFGMAAMGFGKLLSPMALGAAAVGLLGRGMWDLNADMTTINATLKRNAELTGMSATNLWAMGQAARTIGGDPAAVQAGIASLQTALAGASIGVGSAVPQMIGMARLRRFGARYNAGGFGQGANEESLFQAVHSMYLQQGRAKTMALVMGSGLMSEDQANLAMSSGGFAEYQKAQARARGMATGGGFEAVVRRSLQSQVGLGEKDIAAAITAESAYGGIQQPMQTIVGLLTNIYAVLNSTMGLMSRLVNFLAPTASTVSQQIKGAINGTAGALGLKAPFKAKNGSLTSRISGAMKALLGMGMPIFDAAAMIGNEMQESSLNPFASNKGHVGLAQWDKTRRASFAKMFGYELGSSSVSPFQQSADQQKFAVTELMTTHRAAANAMSKASTLADKTKAFMQLDEVVNDNSFARRLFYAKQALASVTNDTKIGDVHIHTPSTDPASHARAFKQGILDQPLLDQLSQNVVSLSTRGMQ